MLITALYMDRAIQLICRTRVLIAEAEELVLEVSDINVFVSMDWSQQNARVLPVKYMLSVATNFFPLGHLPSK